MKSAGPADVAILLAYAQRVIIVPGYGLAVAQAQHAAPTGRPVDPNAACRSITPSIPSLAGCRHMNVLLAEAQVPYEQLKEMDEIDPEFKQADVALVVGAIDVVDPPPRPPRRADLRHADSACQPGAPGRLHEAFDAPSFAGIENELSTSRPPPCSSVTPRTPEQTARRAQGPHPP